MNFDYFDRVVYAVRAGSVLYGTNNKGSDEDIRGIIIPPSEYFFGLSKFEQYIKNNEIEDWCLFDIRKFFHLAIKGNPNILELLWSEEPQCGYGNRIRNLRDEFVTKKIIPPHIGMATAHLKKAQRGNINWKDLSHTVRVLEQCVELLSFKKITFPRQNRDQLKNIRLGQFSLDYIKGKAQELLQEIRRLENLESIPKLPKFSYIEHQMMQIVRDYLAENSELS